MTTTSSILLPPDWHSLESPDTGLDLFEPTQMPPSGFMPLVTAYGVTSTLPLPDLLHRQCEQLQAVLDGVVIEESEIQDLGSHDAGYLRALHRDGDHHLITELWLWVRDDTAWILSATVDLRDYTEFDEIFETMAWSFASQ